MTRGISDVGSGQAPALRAGRAELFMGCLSRSALVAVFLGAALLSSGCATVVKGSSQTLTVDTRPPGAACVFTRKGQTIGVVNPTPGSLMVDKSSEAIAVSCTKEGYHESAASIASEFQAATLGNILIGGIIGIVVDAASGAINQYAPYVSLVLTPVQFADAAARDAFFAKMREDFVAESAKVKQRIREQCSGTGCEEELKTAEETERTRLADIDRKRQLAKIQPAESSASAAPPAGATTDAPIARAPERVAVPPDRDNLGDILGRGARKLSADESIAVLTSGTIYGFTLSGEPVEVSYKRDGSLTGSVGGGKLSDGRWRHDDAGRVCVDYRVPELNRTAQNVCRYWFVLGRDLYVPADSTSDWNHAAQVTRRTFTPISTAGSALAAAQKTSTSAAVPPAARQTASPPVAPPPSNGPLALQQGDLWEYSFVDSRTGRSAPRKFEIEQTSKYAIVERIELENGKTLAAEHRKGAYLTMAGGMQFAPYYFAFRADRPAGRLGDIKVEGGDACEAAPKSVYNTYDCEVSAEFQGTEPVTVPAGTFDAQRVRVEIYRRVWGAYGGQPSGVIAVGQFWISPKAGRVVKAEVQYDLAHRWSEKMELISLRAAGGAGRRADR